MDSMNDEEDGDFIDNSEDNQSQLRVRVASLEKLVDYCAEEFSKSHRFHICFFFCVCVVNKFQTHCMLYQKGDENKNALNIQATYNVSGSDEIIDNFGVPSASELVTPRSLFAIETRISFRMCIPF